MTTSTLPDIESYPKTIMLRDETRVVLRPLMAGDQAGLLDLFQRLPEEERVYLKEDVTSPQVIQRWTNDIDFSRVIPIVALFGDNIIADATLHRSRAIARSHIGEIRIVVDPAFREVGLGRRLIRELLDVAVNLGLHKVFFQLVSKHEDAAISAAMSMGFQQVGVLEEWIRDSWGDYRDLVQLELPLRYYQLAYYF
ncbi:MAG TPA: GNAT family N-acetyltransferase [Dehalococcoidia bacterium]|nr:GNAT family N-acetyltransferase [Dehalococcoidia bacterium]